ncbi:protein of unknown function [Methylorubrum extorquens]|uniref:Uncharacterized protein n=1 Tax=Methylorubrum extorquens TaxID=408 RepID=A0A2N9ANK2_METEX|nr:protein of unknown function [Methylorubrum extorquens]
MTGPAASSRTTIPPTTCATSICRSCTSCPARSASRVPSPATCSWSICSISAPSPRASGASTASSRRTMAAAFSTSTSPQAQKSIWDFEGMFTKSRHVPGVRFPGLIHPGLIGCLPDPKMLETWNTREKALYDTNPSRVPALATLPFGPTAHMGRLKGDAKDNAAATGARTVPGREHGGNCDIKDLSRGSKIYFPRLRSRRRPLDGRPAFQPGRR